MSIHQKQLKIGRLIISSILIGFFLSSSSTLFADDQQIVLSSAVLMEHLSKADIDSGSRILHIQQTRRPIEQTNKLFFLRIHSKTTNNDPWCPLEAMDRVKFYAIEKPNPHDSALQLIGIGKSNIEFDKTRSSVGWPKVMDYGLENAKQLATWKLKFNKESKEFEMECQLIDKNLRKQNINIFAISYQDWVDNPFPISDATGVIDVTYRNIARDFPFTGKGQGGNFDINGKLTKKFKLPRINEYAFNNSGFVIGLQNMDTKEIVGTTLCRFASLNGIDKPAYFNWNNLPECIFAKDEKGKWLEKDGRGVLKKEAFIRTGLQEMRFNLKNTEGKDIRHIELEIYQNSNDKQFYDILGFKIPENQKDNISSIKFDRKTNRISVDYENVIDSYEQIEAFSLITHYKVDNLSKPLTVGYPVKNIIITNEEKNLIYFDGNNIQDYFDNQLLISINPLDLNSDTWVDEKDMEQFISNFGQTSKDVNFDKIYDIFPPAPSDLPVDKIKQGDGRIDLLDFLELQKEIERQEKLLQIVKEQNPGFQKNQTIFTPTTLTPTSTPASNPPSVVKCSFLKEK